MQGVLDLGGSRNASLIANLEEIKQVHHLKIIITTNTSLSQDNDPHGVSSLADLIVNSTPSTPKPSPEFWNEAFSQARSITTGLQINEVLLIDDRSDIIESARDFGLQTLHYSPGVSEVSLKEIFSQAKIENKVISTPEQIDQYFTTF